MGLKAIMENPPPEVLDGIASFVEVAEDLAHEPFLATDEPSSWGQTVNGKIWYRLGDRAHFRSALISFRRLWMKGEPSNYSRVCNGITKYGSEETIIRSSTQRRLIDELRKSKIDNIPDLTVQEMLELWLNTVFAHGGLDPHRPYSRRQFDEITAKIGIGRFEYAFRMSVRTLCWQLIYLNQDAVTPQLQEWENSFEVRPSFILSSPFGRKMRERMPDGNVVIRQSSSRFFNEESIERRLTRLLRRSQLKELGFFFDNFETTESGKVLLVLGHDDIVTLVQAADCTLVEMAPLPDDYRKMTSFMPMKITAPGVGQFLRHRPNIEIRMNDEGAFFVSTGGISHINYLLGELRATLMRE